MDCGVGDRANEGGVGNVSPPGPVGREKPGGGIEGGGWDMNGGWGETEPLAAGGGAVRPGLGTTGDAPE